MHQEATPLRRRPAITQNEATTVDHLHFQGDDETHRPVPERQPVDDWFLNDSPAIADRYSPREFDLVKSREETRTSIVKVLLSSRS